MKTIEEFLFECDIKNIKYLSCVLTSLLESKSKFNIYCYDLLMGIVELQIPVESSNGFRNHWFISVKHLKSLVESKKDKYIFDYTNNYLNQDTFIIKVRYKNKIVNNRKVLEDSSSSFPGDILSDVIIYDLAYNPECQSKIIESDFIIDEINNRINRYKKDILSMESIIKDWQRAKFMYDTLWK